MSKRKSSSDNVNDSASDSDPADAEASPLAGADESSAVDGDARSDATDASAETVDADAAAVETDATPSVTDPGAVDPVEAETPATDTADALPAVAESTNEDAAPTEPETPPDTQSPAPPPPAARPSRPWFALFNFLLIIALAAAAGYYWQEQQKLDATYRADINELRAQLDRKASTTVLESSLKSNIEASLSPIKGELGNLSGRIDTLGGAQQNLRESTETLYELFGRDRNDWQLAEVEYLMRVAQHQLILQDDFEGAAITLQAASDRIGLTGDIGLMPVRVRISEEIADLKTRRRPDLVGMTLILAQLGRQVRSLQPGFALRLDGSAEPSAELDQPAELEPPSDLETLVGEDWLSRFNQFVDSLVTIRKESTDPTEIEANVIDVAAALEDNLKLTRWAVLERDGRQYQVLMERNLRLFREFYDLDNAANFDFMQQLQDLQKMEINPEKPDITGSLRDMQRILSQRDNEPAPAVEETGAPASGEADG